MPERWTSYRLTERVDVLSELSKSRELGCREGSSDRSPMFFNRGQFASGQDFFFGPRGRRGRNGRRHVVDTVV